MVRASSQRSPLRKAFVASFAIYFLPIAGPHWIWLLGQFLFMNALPYRIPGWMAMNFGLALAMQLAVGALCYGLFALPKPWCCR